MRCAGEVPTSFLESQSYTMASINAQKRKRLPDTLSDADYAAATRFLAYMEILQTRMREDEKARQDTLTMELAVIQAKIKLEEVRQVGWSCAYPCPSEWAITHACYSPGCGDL